VWSHVGGGRELHALCRRIAVGNLTHHRGQSPAELGCFGSAARGASAPGTNHQWELAPTDYSRLPRRASRVRFQRVARWRERGGSAEIRVSARFLTMSGRAEGLQRGSRGSGPGGSLPRADSQGMSHGLGGRDPTRPPLPSSRPATGIGFIGVDTTPGELLTANRHHLMPGALWRLDTAGAPKALQPRAKRAIASGSTATCTCGATTGYGPDPSVASTLAMRKCFACRVRRVAALDPRGPSDPQAQKDALAEIHRQDVEARRRGGCDCDGPVGRLFNAKTARPFGWRQDHRGQSLSQKGDWEGGSFRSQKRAQDKQKLPWSAPRPRARPQPRPITRTMHRPGQPRPCARALSLTLTARALAGGATSSSSCGRRARAPTVRGARASTVARATTRARASCTRRRGRPTRCVARPRAASRQTQSRTRGWSSSGCTATPRGARVGRRRPRLGCIWAPTSRTTCGGSRRARSCSLLLRSLHSCPYPPPPPSRTNLTRLVPPPVLIGHVSSRIRCPYTPAVPPTPRQPHRAAASLLGAGGRGVGRAGARAALLLRPRRGDHEPRALALARARRDGAGCLPAPASVGITLCSVMQR
jgi:hypothetical protein